MNRRDLFKGLAATMVAASIPFPVEALIAAPNNQALRYLKRAQLELMHKLINPPVVMNRFGVIIYSAENPDLVANMRLALSHITRLIKELS